jgi:hypothetical protein
MTKVFWFFFSKKNIFPGSTPAVGESHAARRYARFPRPLKAANRPKPCCAAARNDADRENPRPRRGRLHPRRTAKTKSLFASFSSEKEDSSSFSEEKEAKRLYVLRRFALIGSTPGSAACDSFSWH